MSNIPGRDIHVRLFRDSLTTPWGFRLSGGKDLHMPLTIQRVAVGSPVEGEIHRDDIILEIQNQDATRMTHKQAQDAIRNSGGSLILRVRRPQGGSHQHYKSASPGPASTPVVYDYHPPYRSYMMGRLQEALNSVIGSNPMTSSGYGGSSSLSDYGDYNNMSPPPSSIHSPVGVKYPTWNTRPIQRKPPTIQNLMEPGWTPQCLIDNPPGRRRPQQQQQQQQQPSRRVVSASSHQPFERSRPVLDDHAETPAWLGSLRPSIEAKQTDRTVTGFQPSPHDSYQQAHGAPYSVPGTSTIEVPPGAQHLQYNSPLGLYSKSTVQEAITGQPNNGGVTASNGFASTSSNLQRMVQESDRKTRSRQRPEASGGLGVPASDPQSIRQSPSLHLLESRFVQQQQPDQRDGSAAGVGISDF